MRTSLLAFSTIVALATGASAEVFDTKRKAILALLDTTGSRIDSATYARSMGARMQDAVRRVRTDVSLELAKEVGTQVEGFVERSLAAGGMDDRLVAVYDRHFTLGEIEELTRFYASPTGRKYVQLVPDLMRDGMAAGQEWFEEIWPDLAKRVASHLRERGVTLSPSEQEALGKT